MIQLQSDFSVQIVSSHNETMEWCSQINSKSDYYTYRANDKLLASRQAHLSNVMHHRSHQMEY